MAIKKIIPFGRRNNLAIIARFLAMNNPGQK